MHVVIAPDSFKESLTAIEAAEAMAAGVRDVVPDAQCVLVPMADGGEGFAETVAAALGADLHEVGVTGPLGDPVTATYAVDLSRRLAVVDVAQAVGLDLVARADRDVMRADTFGVGELVLAAVEHDVDELIIGLGGSATNDGGAGLLRALGADLLDDRGASVQPGPAGLQSISSVDLSGVSARAREVRVRLASDVTNPLLGEQGASAVFGPQKGASDDQVDELDALLGRLAELVDPEGRTQQSPGAGAAGGLGFALQHALGATSTPGVEIVAELTGLAAHLDGADLVLTGEGSMDGQTLAGKTPFGVARLAAEPGVPVVGLAGRLGPGADKLLDHGFVALVPIVQGITDLPTALAEGGANLRRAVATSVRLLRTTL